MPPRGRSSPYPALGSPQGDEIIGKCQIAGCEKDLRRGEVFFYFLKPGFVCLNCRVAMENK